MQFREFEKLNVKASLLGFGGMRFPVKDGKIDRELAQQMIDLAYENGVNYFDTAVFYHGGESETFMGEALSKFPRESIFIADKMPPWQMNSKEDVEKTFEGQLKKLKTDYFDFYLIHGIGRNSIPKIQEYDIINFLEKKRAEGKIKYLGFSLHDTPEALSELLELHNWDFVQLQLNYVDWEVIRAKGNYELLVQKDIPCIVMEPVRGGSLHNFSGKTKEVFTNANPDATLASWAIRWVASLPNVKVILSGMSALEHVKDNLETCSNFKPLTSDEYNVIEEALEIINQAPTVPCTACKYCMPCPVGVNIPENFLYLNEYIKYENLGHLKWRCNAQLKKEEKSSECIACGKCSAKCPQHIDIPAELEKMTKLLNIETKNFFS